MGEPWKLDNYERFANENLRRGFRTEKKPPTNSSQVLYRGRCAFKDVKYSEFLFFFFTRKRERLYISLQMSVIAQITNPDTINHLTDFEDITVDTVTKANYPWVVHLVNRMNAT